MDGGYKVADARQGLPTRAKADDRLLPVVLSVQAPKADNTDGLNTEITRCTLTGERVVGTGKTEIIAHLDYL